MPAANRLSRLILWGQLLDVPSPSRHQEATVDGAGIGLTRTLHIGVQRAGVKSCQWDVATLGINVVTGDA